MKKARVRTWMASAAAVFLTACGTRPPVLGPVPQQIREIEGYVSLRISADGETAKFKFSFVLEPPDRGRVEVRDFLNRTVVEILARENKTAFLILLRERAYYEGSPENIIDKFLGFPLTLEETANLISGRWDKAQAGSWALEADAGGRWVAGGRRDFRFMVREFFPGSPVPRRLDFESGPRRGSLTVLALGFNRPLKGGLFAADFLKSFTPKSWEEIERLLRHED